MSGKTILFLTAVMAFVPAASVQAQEVQVEMRQISAQGVGDPIGTVTLSAEGQG